MKRRSSGASEFSPQAERKDAQLATPKEQGVSRMLTINLNDVEKELNIR